MLVEGARGCGGKERCKRERKVFLHGSGLRDRFRAATFAEGRAQAFCGTGEFRKKRNSEGKGFLLESEDIIPSAELPHDDRLAGGPHHKR